ncbi:hypothetical protein GDO78_022683 [Eleutherodactylus coqui]|uniref:Uncharacterized protein n=1 Tax=Eleutherodactylus coqui TaxID=57060 RepID=A0A8J6EG55_ELECQ|nr:hypothetical protein GDO78_022683 [Eleutherodactylus coqui]
MGVQPLGPPLILRMGVLSVPKCMEWRSPSARDGQGEALRNLRCSQGNEWSGLCSVHLGTNRTPVLRISWGPSGRTSTDQLGVP